MREGRRIGAVSLAFGAVAIVLAVVGLYAKSVQNPGTGYVLTWLDAHGFVKPPDPHRLLEIRSPSPFLITDAFAVQWLLVHSWWFSACAVAFSLWAELKNELTNLSSAGFICGALAVMQFTAYGSLAVMVAGAAMVTVVRRRRRKEPNPSIERTVAGKPAPAAHVER
jgi:hypothetical protein